MKALFSTEDREKAEETRTKALEEASTDSKKENLDTSVDEKSSDDFEFGPGKPSSGKKPKSDLVVYLEAKNQVIHLSIS